ESARLRQAALATDHLHAVIIEDIPLLIESGQAQQFDRVIVVIADYQTRLQRLVDVRGMDASDAKSRIAAQATDEQRRAVADWCIDNSGTLDETRAQVATVWSDLTGNTTSRCTDKKTPLHLRSQGPTITTRSHVFTANSMTRVIIGWLAVLILAITQQFLAPPVPGVILVLVLAGVVVIISICSFGVVTQAEKLAQRMGDPYGSLVLTISIVLIEVILISAVMLGPGDHTTIGRDSVMAV